MNPRQAIYRWLALPALAAIILYCFNGPDSWVWFFLSLPILTFMIWAACRMWLQTYEIRRKFLEKYPEERRWWDRLNQ